uniref:Uncharacterized protein n=1 Tax=Fagus sylvatica TaxID=28930 RepID=A0A2N9HL09_FAGSY
MYDGKTDPIGHISHFRQSMALHLGNDALMCRMFPSSLGSMSLRWFNRLQHSSIHSWDELAKAFVSRFITNSKKPKEFDSLLSMRMKDSESLKSYSSRYWEVYNEMDGCTEEIAIKTFKLGLDPESELRHNLSRRSAKCMRDLMSRIEQDKGHMTERSYSLKQHLEELAKAGHLRRYLGDGQKQHYHERPTVAHNTKPAARVAEGSVVSKKPRTDFPSSEQQIFFSDKDLREVQTPHDDPLVVKLRIGDSDVKRVLIDQCSCSEIMYPDLFHGLGLKQSDLQPYDAPLVGFSGKSIRPMVPRVDPDYIQHRLNVDPRSKLVQQKARRSAPIHAEAMQKEVERLLQAAAIRELHYSTWLSNTVVVKKKNGKWRGIIKSPYQPRTVKRPPSSLHWGYTTTSGDALPPPREGRSSIGHSGQETTSIFPNAYHLRGNAISGASHVSKGRLHWLDFKMGCEDWCLRRKVPTKTAIKGQVLADFVAEFTPALEHKELNAIAFQEDSPENSGWWKIHTDGASNAKGSGTGVVIITPDETVIEQSIQLDFKASNNEAEYEAVLAGLNSAKTLGAKNLIVHCDSLLIASQINGEYMDRDERMAAYLLKTFKTTPQRSTGETPFSLAYGSETVIPLEIGLPTLRTFEWEPTRNDLTQSQALDLLEERREQAMIRLASYQQQLKKGYNKNVRQRSFQQGNLVLRKVLGNTKNLNDGKLGHNWEGPYRVRSVTGVGAYHLEDLNSIPLPRPWNVSNLRKYFH